MTLVLPLQQTHFGRHAEDYLDSVLSTSAEEEIIDETMMIQVIKDCFILLLLNNTILIFVKGTIKNGSQLRICRVVFVIADCFEELGKGELSSICTARERFPAPQNVILTQSKKAQIKLRTAQQPRSGGSRLKC